MKKDKVKTMKPAVLLLISALALSACGNGNKAAKDAGEEEAVPVFAVNTSIAVLGQIADYLALSGDIVAGSTVDAYSDAAGKVTKLYVSVGDRVRKDDPIAEVDPSRPGMTYVAGVAKAPISGTIVALPAQVGMTINQSVPVARISGGSVLDIKLYVAERFISQIFLNQPVLITLDAYPGENFRGRVSEISPVVDPASRTMEVKIGIENPGSKLKAGMFAKVRIITQQKDNIVKVPVAALIQRFGETYVFTTETDPSDPAFQVARKTTVVPGISIDGIVEITKGLSPDQEIVVRGQTLLEDGYRINVIEREAPLSAASN